MKFLIVTHNHYTDIISNHYCKTWEEVEKFKKSLFVTKGKLEIIHIFKIEEIKEA